MAIVTVPNRGVRITESYEIANFLSAIDIDYERCDASRDLPPDTSDNEILEAYSNQIERLNLSGGYTTADVINVTQDTPGLDAMLDRFNKEHWHDEDEVRFIVGGSGIFHIAPRDSDVVAIEMGEGDMIRVPRGTLHWFDLCGDRSIRAIRLFQDPAGWTPHYTISGVEAGFEPVCLGLSHISASL